jgi:hypothetical protein
MATRGLRFRGSVGQPRSRKPGRRFQGTPGPVVTSHLCSNVLPPPPAFALRRQPVPSVSLSASRQGSWFSLAAPPFARPSVRLAAPLRSLTGSITRTIERLRSGSRKGKRAERNPEVVPTNMGDVPRPTHVVPSAVPGRPQAIPKRRTSRRARALSTALLRSSTSRNRGEMADVTVAPDVARCRGARSPTLPFGAPSVGRRPPMHPDR